jgi:hypothetical protein
MTDKIIQPLHKQFQTDVTTFRNFSYTSGRCISLQSGVISSSLKIITGTSIIDELTQHTKAVLTSISPLHSEMI